MPLKFAALVPHTPILLTAREETDIAPKTIQSFEYLDNAVRFSQIDTVVLIGPHGLSLPKTTILNVAPEYTADLEQFGDLKTHFILKGAPILAQRFVERLAGSSPIQQATDLSLDFCATIPLLFLPGIREKRFLIIHPPREDFELAFDLGQKLRNLLDQETQRFMLCASTDLSMRHAERTPAGHSPGSVAFDAAIRRSFDERRFTDLLSIDQNLIEDAGSCGFSTILTLAGALNGLHTIESILSEYEIVEGTGLFTVGYALHGA